MSKVFSYKPLAKSGNVTMDAAMVGIAGEEMHIFTTESDSDGEIKNSISLYLSAKEVGDIIKGLKRKLLICYKNRVDLL